MKTLFSTTALVVALGFPTVLLAQTAAPRQNPEKAAQGVDIKGFLANRGESDMFASELMGHDVYARRTPRDMATSERAARNADGTYPMMGMKRTDLDDMDKIGQISEIVLTGDGQIRAIVISVGGFLGMGAQDVAVTMDQVTFASNADDRSETYIVVNTGAEMLKSSPRYERSAMASGERMGAQAGTQAGTQPGAQAGVQSGGGTSDRTAFIAPKVARDGYDQVAVKDVSADMLIGKSVYGLNDNSVGTIDDLILDDAGKITNVIIDFGGFLGMGTSQVSVGFGELTVLADGGRSDVRVYVDATKEQVQAQPQYRKTN